MSCTAAVSALYEVRRHEVSSRRLRVAADSDLSAVGGCSHETSPPDATDTDRQPSTASAEAPARAFESLGTGLRSGTPFAGDSVKSRRCSGAQMVFRVLGAHQATTCD